MAHNDLVAANLVYPPVREGPASRPYLPTRFDGRRVIITSPAEEVMRRHGIDPHRLLERHQSGDWGDQSIEDKKAWDRALEDGFSSLMSVYEFGGEEVWLLTDVERLVTTFVSSEEPY